MKIKIEFEGENSEEAWVRLKNLLKGATNGSEVVTIEVSGEIHA